MKHGTCCDFSAGIVIESGHVNMIIKNSHVFLDHLNIVKINYCCNVTFVCASANLQLLEGFRTCH